MGGPAEGTLTHKLPELQKVRPMVGRSACSFNSFSPFSGSLMVHGGGVEVVVLVIVVIVVIVVVVVVVAAQAAVGGRGCGGVMMGGAETACSFHGDCLDLQSR